MTTRLEDLDNSETFYARIYEAVHERDEDWYSADEARIPQNKEAAGKELALPLAAICQLLQKWIGN